MIMADVLKIFLLVVGALIIFNSYWLVSKALFPRMVEESSKNYRERPIKSLILGLVVGGPLVLMGLAILDKLAGHPLMNILGWSFILIPALLGVMGSTGLSHKVGCGLPSPKDEGRPWLRVLRGGVVLSFTFLLPFVGWFVVLPATVVSGFGSAILSIREARREFPAHPIPADLEGAAV